MGGVVIPIVVALIAAAVIVGLIGFGLGYAHGRDVEAEWHKVPDWTLRHPASRERGATLPTHALVIAVLVGAWMLSGYLFGGWGS